MKTKKPNWLRTFISGIIQDNLAGAGFGHDDLIELRLLVEERRRLKEESKTSADKFLNRLKELSGG